MLYKDATAQSSYDAGQARRFRWRDALLTAPNVSCMGKLTGQLLAMHYNVETGACYPSEELLALELRKTTRTIANAIHELKLKKWIAVERKNRQRNNWYELLDTHVDDVFTLNSDMRDDLKDERERKRRSSRNAGRTEASFTS